MSVLRVPAFQLGLPARGRLREADEARGFELPRPLEGCLAVPVAANPACSEWRGSQVAPVPGRICLRKTPVLVGTVSSARYPLMPVSIDRHLDK